MKILRKSKTDIAKLTTFYMRLVFICLFITGLISSQTGCYLHSDEQEDLAKDILERYSLIQPAGDVALQNLETDLNQMLDAQKANTDLLTLTSEVVIVEKPWAEMIKLANQEKTKLDETSKETIKGFEKIKKDQERLQKQKEKLEAALETTDEALAKLEDKKSLKERLETARQIIKTTTAAIDEAIKVDAGDPINQRLKNSVDEIVKYLDGLKNEETKTEKTYSLLLESFRLGRDITALQIEAIETEENHIKRVTSIYTAKTELLKQVGSIEQYIAEFEKHKKSSPNENVAQTVQKLSEVAHNSQDDTVQKTAESDLKNLLDNLAAFQTLQITTDSRLDDLDLRLKVENYRYARLLDTVYERQRMILISTGLDGVVRYSEGGWRSEDIGRISNIIGTVAQIVIAARVN